jgi:hypothetical protein
MLYRGSEEASKFAQKIFKNYQPVQLFLMVAINKFQFFPRTVDYTAHVSSRSLLIGALRVFFCILHTERQKFLNKCETFQTTS